MKKKPDAKELTRRSRKSKQKGYTFEKEIVTELVDDQIEAYRIWGSDGRAMGFSPRVDVVALRAYLIQCKRKAKLPAWLSMKDVHAVVIREDNGETYAVIRFSDLKKILRRLVDEPSPVQ